MVDRNRKWQPDPVLWEKIKPLARQMRREPTTAENQLWVHLRNRQLLGFKFRRQHPVDKFIVDFYCGEARLVVEIDGEIHQYTVDEDAIRQEFLENLGFHVVRFANEQVLSSLDAVIEHISTALDTSKVVSSEAIPLSAKRRGGQGVRSTGGLC